DGRLHITASEIFVRRNTNRSIEDTFLQLPEWIATYRKAGVATDCINVMAAFGCNFEGDISAERIVGMLQRTTDILAEHGETLTSANLCDTMGWANPGQITRVVAAVRDRWPDLRIKLHLHDTRGLAMANAYAALQVGVAEFDG